MAKRNYEQIALLVLTQPTLKAAAEKGGISYKTLMRYRKDPEFQAALQAEKKVIFHDTMQKAQAYTMEALETLREIQNNPALNESARVSAAKGIFVTLRSVKQSTGSLPLKSRLNSTMKTTFLLKWILMGLWTHGQRTLPNGWRYRRKECMSNEPDFFGGPSTPYIK